MMKTECPHCQARYDIDSQCEGKVITCPNCNQEFYVENCKDSYQTLKNGFRSTVDANPPKPKLKQYKVLTQKDGWITERFDPVVLEQTLNSYAANGWRVVSAATASIYAVFGGNRDELIIILERDA